MRYQEAYHFLESIGASFRLERLKSRTAARFFLERTRRFLSYLDHPETKIPHIIHVTGTSGKGSVSLMLASILRATGYRVGTMTSPAPDGLMGRVEIDGTPLTPAFFARLTTRCKEVLDRHYSALPLRQRPSFFELLTALGFLAFIEKQIDWAVVEVGLGGRFDPTNVLPCKNVAVITNIGFDHTDILGKTKKQIAWHKAGIITPGCTVFTEENAREALAVIQKECKKQHVPLITVRTKARAVKVTLSGVRFAVGKNTYRVPALGEHQVRNALLARAVAQKIGVSEKYIQRGLQQVILPARCEVVSQKPLIILDGAHNPDKIQATVNTLRALQGRKTVHLVIGFAADKEWPTMVRQLATLRPATVACTRFTKNLSRLPANPNDLARVVQKQLPRTAVKTFSAPDKALAWSRKQQKTGDVLLVTGSLYLAGEIRPLLFSAK